MSSNIWPLLSLVHLYFSFHLPRFWSQHWAGDGKIVLTRKSRRAAGVFERTQWKQEVAFCQQPGPAWRGHGGCFPWGCCRPSPSGFLWRHLCCFLCHSPAVNLRTPALTSCSLQVITKTAVLRESQPLQSRPPHGFPWLGRE